MGVLGNKIKELGEKAEERAEEKIFEEGGYSALWQYRAIKFYQQIKTCSCCA